MSKANGARIDDLRYWLYFIADVEYNMIMFARAVGYWCWNNPNGTSAPLEGGLIPANILLECDVQLLLL